MYYPYTNTSAPAPPGHLLVRPEGRVRYVDNIYWASLCREVWSSNLPPPRSRFDNDWSLKVGELDALLSGRSTAALSGLRRESNSSGEDEDIATSPIRSFALSLGETHTPVRDLHDPAPTALDILEENMLQPSPMRQRSSQREVDPIRPGETPASYLPKRGQCEVLIGAYIKGYHPLVSLIHVPSFLTRFEEFWNMKNTYPPTHANPFFALILAVCFAGAVSCTNMAMDTAFGPKPRNIVSTDLRKAAMKALRGASFPRIPTLETLTAYVICQTTWMRGAYSIPSKCRMLTSFRGRATGLLVRAHIDGSLLKYLQGELAFRD